MFPPLSSEDRDGMRRTVRPGFEVAGQGRGVLGETAGIGAPDGLAGRCEIPLISDRSELIRK